MGGSFEQEAGKEWESIFDRLAPYQGLLSKPNHVACIRTPRGFKQIKSQLDRTVFLKPGRVGYFDLKSFGQPFFTYSKLLEHQIAEAVQCNEWGVPAGFIVLFRPTREVSFYSGAVVAEKGPGSRFVPSDGIQLGKLESLNLRLIFP